MSRLWWSLALSAVLLCSALSGWLTASFYRARLEAMRIEQARCVDSGQALQTQLALQNGQIEALEETARQRSQSAVQALAAAQEQADAHEDSARRLLLERSTGDECVVVRQLIAQELLR